MNEAETRAEQIAPALKAAGWGVVEAKRWDLPHTEGLAQAKSYADKLCVSFSYATNGQHIDWPAKTIKAGGHAFPAEKT